MRSCTELLLPSKTLSNPGKTHSIHSIFLRLLQNPAAIQAQQQIFFCMLPASRLHNAIVLCKGSSHARPRIPRMRLATPWSSTKALSQACNEHLECALQLGKFPPSSPNDRRQPSHDDIHYILFSGTSYFTWLRAGNVFKWTSDHNCHAELAQKCKIFQGVSADKLLIVCVSYRQELDAV